MLCKRARISLGVFLLVSTLVLLHFTTTPYEQHDASSDQSIAQVRSLCGELCDPEAGRVTAGTFPLFGQRVVPMNCIDLFGDALYWMEGHGQLQSPKSIPRQWRSAFTLNGEVPITDRWFNMQYLGKVAAVSQWTADLIDMQVSEATVGRLAGTYGVDETNALLDGLSHAPGVKGGRVLVVGSERPWVEACVLATGASEVVTLEYGAINCTHPLVTTMTPPAFKAAHSDGSLGRFDAVVTFSSVEHSGLGRYGDALNPWGDILEIARSWCVTKPGGSLTIGVMYGSDELVFNAHRIYGKKRWPLLASNWAQHYVGRGDQKVHVFTKPHERPRHLQYVCDGAGCGGWGDRWKGAVAVYALALETGRTFRMGWRSDEISLGMVFEDHVFFAEPPGQCKIVSWIDAEAPPLNEVLGSTAECISLHMNIYPAALSRWHDYNDVAKQLWGSLTLLPVLQQRIDRVPDNLRCAQLRLGSSAGGSFANDVQRVGTPNTVEERYARIMTWFESSPHTHLWTDSAELEHRWLETMGHRAVAVEGPIVHIDRDEKPSERGLQRAVIEWLLISRCHEIAYQTGFIQSGLFLAPEASQVRKISEGAFAD